VGLLLLHINLSQEQDVTGSMRHLLHVYQHYKDELLPENKMLD
jgi:hypothetical protein